MIVIGVVEGAEGVEADDNSIIYALFNYFFHALYLLRFTWSYYVSPVTESLSLY